VRARAAALGGLRRRDRAAAQERRDEAVRDDVGGERGLGGRLQQGGAVDLSELDDALGGADRLIDVVGPREQALDEAVGARLSPWTSTGLRTTAPRPA
jgi:hypothetical protein